MKLSATAAVQATTVRADLRGLDCDITAGVGGEGDVVVARVIDPGGITGLIDWKENKHPVAAGTVFLGVLANRDSTTHASGVVPATGVPIDHGTRLDWLGGQSGLLGRMTWSPAVGNQLSSQASGSVEAIGLATVAGRPLNISQLTRPATPRTACAPLLVVCGSAAEVGKTTTTCGIIRLLAHEMSMRVVAIKPTGSGGIADSIAHRRAGAALTYDLVDSGLPSSYTSAARYAAHIGRCLDYADERPSDLVICELGGDVIWGNNDTFLQLPALVGRIAGILCIAGDATGALGVDAFFTSIGIDTGLVTYAPAYPRNPYTFAERLRVLLPPQRKVLVDTADPALAWYLRRIRSQLAAS